MARKALISALGVPAALAYVAFVALPRQLRRSFVPPRREEPHHPSSFGLEAEEVWLQAVDGASIRAWHIAQDGPAPLMVVIHGWTGNASLMLPVAPVFVDAGYSMLFIDARNHGASDDVDHMSMPRFAQDLDVALDWATGLNDVTGVGIMGHSIGAGAVVLVASRRSDVEAAVAVGTFSHPGELLRAAPQIDRLPRPAQEWVLRTIERSMGVTLDEIAPRTRIQHATCPVMLVHGGLDEVISHQDFEELSQLGPPGSEALFVPDAVHDRLDEYVPYLTHVVSFLGKHMPPAPPAGE